MPNLHWFGTEADHANVLSDILALDEVQVFELYSDFGKPIRKFTDVDEILAEFQVPHNNGMPRATIHLNLWINGSGPQPTIERVALNPEKCGGHSWRERSAGPGFVQFYLERFADERLNYSWTNTAREIRMGADDGLYTGHDGAVWNIRDTNRFSSKLNRLIMKKAVAKILSCSVLPGAAVLWEAGEDFGQHWSKAKTPDLFKVP